MAYPRELIDQIKGAVFKELEGMREINRTCPVSGRRMKISMPDRRHYNSNA